ncbi:MAG TPA: YhjD/YihY/BrkB family envelope integrity protein [Marmoricola sp.]|nr:YhjD/YihY/BrkB family envelope integrity protein [Marmoricola sp.]
MDVLARADRAQRRHPVLGFPLGVLYKFFDDQGNYLSAALTYYAFVAIFPLLLLASSILGFILQGRPELQQEVLDSALGQFPIIGEQLGRPEGLQGSTGAVVAGALAALYGCHGLGMATQNLMATAWGIPRNSRPNPFLLRFKSLLLLAAAGTAVLSVSVLSALVNTDVFGEPFSATIGWLARLGNVVVVALVLTVLFRLAAAHDHHIVRAAPGAFTVAVGWQVLQHLGTIYATGVLSGTSSMNQTFGLVLGLVGLVYIGAVIAVIGVEVNVVFARRMWPRALLTPFTDSVDLTDADRRAYAAYAQMQRHKGFETVSVRFTGRDGDTHEIVLDTSERDTKEHTREHRAAEPPAEAPDGRSTTQRWDQP